MLPQAGKESRQLGVRQRRVVLLAVNLGRRRQEILQAAPRRRIRTFRSIAGGGREIQDQFDSVAHPIGRSGAGLPEFAGRGMAIIADDRLFEHTEYQRFVDRRDGQSADLGIYESFERHRPLLGRVARLPFVLMTLDIVARAFLEGSP